MHVRPAMRPVAAGLLAVAVTLMSCNAPAARSAAQRFSDAVTRIASHTGSSADDVERSLRSRLGVVDDVTDDAAARAERLADDTAWIDDAARQAAPTMEDVAKQVISSTACDAIQYRLDSGFWPDVEVLTDMVGGNLFDFGIENLEGEQALVRNVEEHLAVLTALAEDEADLFEILVEGGCLFA